ncbi:MAG: hypothetical protein QG596_480 [Actinomycetota bacterium]|jgi:hypothetical protein|nr:hypothetical protein [Actinomycetota bacterium]
MDELNGRVQMGGPAKTGPTAVNPDSIPLGVESVEIVPALFFLRVEPALDQGKDRDEDREEGDHAKAEEGDVAVIDPAGGPEAVGGQGVSRGYQNEKSGKDCDQ